VKSLLAASALLLVLAFPASAANGIAVNEDTPTLGQTISFTATTSRKLDCTGRAGCARVEILCYQNNVLVYGEASDIERARAGFPLGGAIGQGSVWARNGGDAECVANLFRFGKDAGQQTYEVLASTSFSAEG
jgi:hypothetical protein